MANKRVEVWAVQSGEEQKLGYVSRGQPGNTTPPVSVPTIGTISVGAVTDTSIVVNWTAATAPANGPLINYKVYRKTTSPTSVLVGPTTRTYTWTGLTAATNYTFQVSAINSAGESTLSNTISVTTNQPPATQKPAMGAFIGSPWSYSQYVADISTPVAIRTYQSTMVPASFSSSAAYPNIARGIKTHLYSFKPGSNSSAGMNAVINGDFDATINSFLDSAITALPAGHVLWIAFYHEPEDNVGAGTFTAQQWRDAQVKVAGLIHAKNSPKLKFYICLMGYTFEPGSKWNPANFWDNRFDAAVDAIGYDPYYSASVGNNTYLGRLETYSASKSKPTIIAEISISVPNADKTDTNGNSTTGNITQRVSMLNDLYSRAQTNDYIAVTYFETIQDLSDPAAGGDASYCLHYDTQSLAAWEAIQIDSGS